MAKRMSSKQPEWAAKIPAVAMAVVEMFLNDMPKGTQLDFSEDSIKALDKLIKKVYGEDGPSNENLQTMIWAVGCYVAEVLQRNYNGIWKDEGRGYTFECNISGAGVSPWNWVAKRFESGMSEALASKYKLAQSILADDRK
jgi:hypothetical protein